MNEENTENTVEAMIISDSGVITLVIEGGSYTVNPSHCNYTEILDKLKSSDHVGLLDLIDVSKAINDASDGKISVKDGSVYYNGSEIINPLTSRIIQFIKEGLPFDAMVKFLENLLDNPSRNAVQELYLFLEDNLLPITPDGHFLAYKKVRGDYTDCRTGTFDNSVGKVCEMPRNEVCDIRDRTCSNGLHFCSKSYLSHFGGERVVIVKINPSDVVSIPSDYDNAKGRTARYEVIGDCTEEYNTYMESERMERGSGGFDHLEQTVLSREGDTESDTGDCDGCGDEFYEYDLSGGLCDGCETEREAEEEAEREAEEEAEREAEEEAERLAEEAEEVKDDRSRFGKAVDSVLGRKPNGQRFHNKRGEGGRFEKK